MATSIETRTYHILGLLGEGGFGKVYRARMGGAGGFTKDVAIKLLADHDPPSSVLDRFRDESKILGLVRDRAVIGVEPPSQVGGRWAVIMEFVDGLSGSSLLKRQGPLPPKVALEIVHEVARALDNIYRQEGPDGEALQLVHRDLKPANIQITPAGEVKILDFGTARARFEAREATTTKSIAGTYGYIAPERLHGIETPSADIYSLGFVLYRLLTGGKADPPSLRAALRESEGELRTGLELAARMVANDYEHRPTAREVEETAAALARGMDGLTLRRWADTHVPSRSGEDDDDLVGRVLTTTFTIQNDPGNEISQADNRRGLVLLASITGVNLMLVGGGLGVVAVAGLLGWLLVGPPLRGPTEVPPPVPRVAPALEPAPAAPAVDPGPTDPEPTEPEPAPVEAGPSPKPAKPAPPQVARFPVDFGSQPLGAEVLLDGRAIGNTPLFGYHVPAGRHRVTMVSGTQKGSLSIDVGRRKPTRFIWKGGDDWEVLY